MVVSVFGLASTTRIAGEQLPPSTQWDKTYGGSGWDDGLSVQQTKDGGYIIAGGTDSFGTGMTDAYLVKTDANGIEQWHNTFGGSSDDHGWSVQQTTDGGYVIAGYTTSFGARYYDAYLVKTDENGNEQWHKLFGGSANDYFTSVQQTSDGYVMAGYTDVGAGNYDAYLVKTDANGIEQWHKTFGGSDDEIASSVQQTTDGGYILAGATDSFGAGYRDVYLVKTYSNGDEQWHKTFGGSGDDDAISVQQTSDGGFVVAGSTSSGDTGISNLYLVKTDSNGDEQWHKTFGGSGDDDAISVQQTSDGGFVVAGSTSSGDTGISNLYLVKTDSNGDERWSQTFGDGYIGWSVRQTTDGGYIVAGQVYSDVTSLHDLFIVKTDATGIEQWNKTFGGSEEDGGYSVQQTTDGGYIVAGATDSFGAGSYDVYLIKLGAPTPESVIADVQHVQDTISGLQASDFKNPGQQKATMSEQYAVTKSIYAGDNKAASNLQNAMINKLDSVKNSIKAGDYKAALDQLQNDLLAKTDGCASPAKHPDNNDWITNCNAQGHVYPQLLNLGKGVKQL